MYKNRWYNQDGADPVDTGTPAVPQNCEEFNAQASEQDKAVMCTGCVEGNIPEEVSYLCECCDPDQPIIDWNDAFNSLGSDEVATSNETVSTAVRDCWRCDGENVVTDTYEYEAGNNFTCPPGTSSSTLKASENPCAIAEEEVEIIAPPVVEAGLGGKKILLYLALAGVAYYLFTASKAGAVRPMRAR